MRKSDLAAAAGALAAYVLIRGPLALWGPFVLPFETAFQEAIALHHLDHGMMANRLLPVVAVLDGTKFFHTAHPPLLHLLYALLYKALGVHEWVTRFFSLLLWAGSALLWRSTLGEVKRGWLVPALAFGLPIPFLLSSTTNYEPLSVFMVSLLGWLALRREAGLYALLPVLTLGMLVDWPVYLAVPALLVIRRRDASMRRTLLLLLGWEAVFFALLISYQRLAGGEAALFWHAPERADPRALLSPGVWQEAGSHLVGVMGAPALIVCAACLAAHLFRRGPFSRDERARRRAVNFYLVFAALLFALAPGLVSRHFVHLLYLAPLFVMALFTAVSRASLARTAIIALLALFLGRDLILAEHRNPSYYAMAEPSAWWNRGATPGNAMASSAIGAWYFYRGLECAHPVSAALSEWILNHEPDIVHIDRRHSEVAGLSSYADERPGYKLLFALPGERVYVKERVFPQGWEPVSAEKSGPSSPASLFVMTEANQAAYALKQPPGKYGSVYGFELPRTAGLLVTRPEIIHTFPGARTDGVTFMALKRYDGGVGLMYAKHETDAQKMKGPGVPMPVEGAREAVLATLPGPLGDPAFDDAYWLDPVVIKAEGKP